MPRPRNGTLLIGFDAFGTLFSPRAPIAVQYVEMAKRFGITGLKPDLLKPVFRKEFKATRLKHPNYGRHEKNMTPAIWWGNVIKKTFTPFISDQDSAKLEDLVPALIDQFSSSAGYTLHPDAEKLLKFIRDSRSSHLAQGEVSWTRHWNRVIVGVISNSDPRVPMILESFGLKVAPLYAKRNENEAAAHREPANIHGGHASPHEDFDIQFTVLSYNVEIEKPDPGIFTAAETLVKESLLTEDERRDPIVKLYIGDEYDNDIRATFDAGWNSILVDREAKFQDKFPQDMKTQKGLTTERVPALWPPDSYVLQNIAGIGR